MTRAALVHAVLDAFERAGVDYHRLNNLPAQEIGRLAEILARWLQAHGIPID
jgi:hypothetical protein